MKHPPVQIQSIQQKDNHHFSIAWSDGNAQTYRLSDLQQRCPCAQCHVAAGSIDPHVKAVRISNVGRYALKIQFTSGCSRGIYSYALLHSWK